MSSPVYLDIPTMTKRLTIPAQITLPFHHDDPLPYSEERTFTPASAEWPEALERWAFLNGYISVSGAEKGYDPRQPRDAAELPFQRDRAALLAAAVKAFNPAQPRDNAGRWSSGRVSHDFLKGGFNPLLRPLRDSLFKSGWEGSRFILASQAIEDAMLKQCSLVMGKDGDELVSVASFQRGTFSAAQVFGSAARSGKLPGGNYDIVWHCATKRPGYGREMFDAVFKRAAERGNGVALQALKDAIPFYKALGMHKIGRDFFFLTAEEVQERVSNKNKLQEPLDGRFCSLENTHALEEFLGGTIYFQGEQLAKVLRYG